VRDCGVNDAQKTETLRVVVPWIAKGKMVDKARN